MGHNSIEVNFFSDIACATLPCYPWLDEYYTLCTELYEQWPPCIHVQYVLCVAEILGGVLISHSWVALAMMLHSDVAQSATTCILAMNKFHIFL